MDGGIFSMTALSRSAHISKLLVGCGLGWFCRDGEREDSYSKSHILPLPALFYASHLAASPRFRLLVRPIIWDRAGFIPGECQNGWFRCFARDQKRLGNAHIVRLPSLGSGCLVLATIVIEEER